MHPGNHGSPKGTQRSTLGPKQMVSESQQAVERLLPKIWIAAERCRTGTAAAAAAKGCLCGIELPAPAAARVSASGPGSPPTLMGVSDGKRRRPVLPAQPVEWQLRERLGSGPSSCSQLAEHPGSPRGATTRDSRYRPTAVTRLLSGATASIRIVQSFRRIAHLESSALPTIGA
jgi:hypothetical protein